MITLANHRCCILLMATLLASYYLPEARGYEFDMIFQTKCIFEEVYDSAVTLAGKYEAFNRDNVGQPVEVSVRIENPHGEQLYEQKGQSKGDFKLVSTTEGDYKVCFTTKGRQQDYALVSLCHYLQIAIQLVLTLILHLHQQIITLPRTHGFRSSGRRAQKPQIGRQLQRRTI